MLFAGKCNARAMYCISADNIKNLGIFLASRAESSTACRYVIEQVLDLFTNQYRLDSHVYNRDIQ